MADSAPIWLTTTNTVTAPAGTLVLLKALADANPSPQYFWLSNSVPVQIPGTTNNSYAVTATAGTTSVKWSVVASNYLGNATNGPFYVQIPTGPQTSNVWGNVTLSGSNSVFDLLEIGHVISGSVTLTNVARGLADVNQDGTVNNTDQVLIQNDILGRSTLAKVNSLVVADPYNSGIPNWRKWRLGLFQSMADSDGDDVNDGAELADGTDPLDPTSLVPYGSYSASPPVTIFNLTPNPADYGVFVATPPVTIKIQ